VNSDSPVKNIVYNNMNKSPLMSVRGCAAMNSEEITKICLITTGGTISSIYDEEIQALRPGLSVDALLDRLPKGMGNIEVIKKELYQLDSSNAQPHHWQTLAGAIKQVSEEIPDLHGIVISHGTDTMVYSAAAVSFMIQDFGRPIVFTGAQIPASVPWSDGPRNLLDAIRVAAFADIGETCIVFNGEIHRATRTKKVRVNSYDAFDSMDPSPIGILARDIILYEGRKKRDHSLVPRFDTRLEDRVFLLKIFPGLLPQTLARIVDMGYLGIVIEGFGSGNIPTTSHRPEVLHRCKFTVCFWSGRPHNLCCWPCSKRCWRDECL